MKILLLADLHGIAPWYQWITVEARRFDLVCIAGDLIDMFRGRDEQVGFIRDEWLPQFRASGVPLALCSGNHDHSISSWLAYLRDDNLLGDGQSSLVHLRNGESLIVTTCPYVGSFNAQHPETANLWSAGAALAAAHRVPWLVLHHEPPPSLSPDIVINELKKLTRRFTPDYVSCGHFHEGPTALGRFTVTVRSTVFFNAGANPDALVPNHIVLDASQRVARWHYLDQSQTAHEQICAI